MHTTIFSLSKFDLKINDLDILVDASFSISSSEKVVLIGPNGSGKSTLMDYIYNQSRVSTGYAKQNISMLKGNVLEHIQSQDGWWEILELLSNIFDLEISHQMDFNKLSGGEKVKILIAQALKSENQLILLDEPTNHLDLSSVMKLGDYINTDNRAYLIVSHDVTFINSVANKIIEIDNKKLKSYGGNFDSYDQQKEYEILRKQARFEQSKKQISKLENEIKSKLADSTKRKNSLKSKIKSGNSGIPKILAGGLLRKGEAIVSKEKSKLEHSKGFALASLEENRVESRKQILFKIADNNRRGTFINVLNGKLQIEDMLLIKDINFELRSGDRILITGDNGSGKSLFSKNLYYKSSKNLKGEIIYGSEYKTFFIDQNLEMLDPEKNAIENFRSKVFSINDEDIYKFLFSLNFNLDNIKIQISKLSGGEKLKLLFAILNASQFDLLILDEPTNNLDIDSKEVLKRILNEYQGSLVLISHDKNFFESIKINKRYNIENYLLKRIL